MTGSGLGVMRQVGKKRAVVSGMSQQDIQDDFPELTPEDILAALAYAAEREHQVYSYKVK